MAASGKCSRFYPNIPPKVPGLERISVKGSKFMVSGEKCKEGLLRMRRNVRKVCYVNSGKGS